MTAPTEPHVHRWRIETPNGPTSLATCACGVQRKFRNGEPEVTKGAMHSRQVTRRTKRLWEVS